MNNSKQKSTRYSSSLIQLRPRDLKQSDKDNSTKDYDIVNKEWRMEKLPRRPGRRHIWNKVSRKIRQIQVEIQKKHAPRDQRLEKMLQRALWLKRCILNPDMFKSFDRWDDDSINTVKEQESVVSTLLSDPILAADSWSCQVI